MYSIISPTLNQKEFTVKLTVILGKEASIAYWVHYMSIL